MLLAAALAAASCAPGEDDGQDASPETARSEPVDGSWLLVDGVVLPVEDGVITLHFDTPMSISGEIYCNRYGGAVEHGASFGVDDIEVTEQDCGALFSVSASAYFQTLNSVQTARVDDAGNGPRLTLSGELGDLVFAPAP